MSVPRSHRPSKGVIWPSIFICRRRLLFSTGHNTVIIECSSLAQNKSVVAWQTREFCWTSAKEVVLSMDRRFFCAAKEDGRSVCVHIILFNKFQSVRPTRHHASPATQRRLLYYGVGTGLLFLVLSPPPLTVIPQRRPPVVCPSR